VPITLRVIARPKTSLATHVSVIRFPVARRLVVADNHFLNYVQVINECVVCHQKNVTVSVPCVIVITRSLPLVVDE
jgi:hypothetical protein